MELEVPFVAFSLDKFTRVIFSIVNLSITLKLRLVLRISGFTTWATRQVT